MFNFFYEIKKKINTKNGDFESYNIVNISGKALYIEGHKGLLVLSNEKIVVKLKQAQVEVLGRELFLAELTENTLLIEGKIIKVEVL